MSAVLKTRVEFLKQVVLQELKHLQYSDKQVFGHTLTLEAIDTLSTNEVLAEKIEAFGSRFGRLQDTIGQKLLPLWLKALEEEPTSLIDNLAKAEKLGILPSVEEWIRLRSLRNQMVHEYITDNKILLNALTAAHTAIPFIQKVSEALLADFKQRGY